MICARCGEEIKKGEEYVTIGTKNFHPGHEFPFVLIKDIVRVPLLDLEGKEYFVSFDPSWERTELSSKEARDLRREYNLKKVHELEVTRKNKRGEMETKPCGALYSRDDEYYETFKGYYAKKDAEVKERIKQRLAAYKEGKTVESKGGAGAPIGNKNAKKKVK